MIKTESLCFTSLISSSKSVFVLSVEMCSAQGTRLIQTFSAFNSVLISSFIFLFSYLLNSFELYWDNVVGIKPKPPA